MRRIVVWLASTITIVVLLFGYHTSTDKPAAAASSSVSSPSTSSASRTGSSSSASATPRSAPSKPSSGISPSSGGSATTKTYRGSVAQTRWGPVQVQLTVAGSTITDVTVLQQPNGNPRDTEINNRALPILIQGTLAAQSATIDMVSGATVTSSGYLESLQAALDQAGR